MRKTAFIGFGEVNTPVDIIINKCKAAEAALQAEGVELVSVYPVTDDYEEKDIKKALDALRARALHRRLDSDPCGRQNHRAVSASSDGAVGPLRLA